MAYEVKWRRRAIDQLAAILVPNRPVRQFLLDDANRIDDLLTVDPISEGTLNDDGLYSAQVGRLNVIYGVKPTEQRVVVISVKVSV